MKVSIEITNDNLNKFFKDIEKIQGELRSGVINQVSETSLDIETDAKRNCPVDEGRLRSSIGILRKRADGLGTEIGTNVEYAAVVEYGSRAHEIRIKKKKILSDGKSFFGKSVNHPGTKPQPFLFPAFEKNKRLMIDRLNKLLKSL